MSSPLVLFSSHVPAVPANGVATPGTASGLSTTGAASTGMLGHGVSGHSVMGNGVPGAPGERTDKVGNFLTSFIQLMQQTPKGLALQNPLPLQVGEGLHPVMEIIPESAAPLDLVIPALDPQLDGLLGDSTSAESPQDPLLLDESAIEIPLGAELVISSGDSTTDALALPEVVAAASWMPVATHDGIPAEAPALPPVAAATVINPTQPELDVEGQNIDPTLALGIAAAAPLSATNAPAPELPNTGKRLDLTQWLSGASPSANADLPEEASPMVTTASGALSLTETENTDVLLKNAIFGNTLPKGLVIATRETAEWNEPVISETLVRPAAASAPGPAVADISNTGRIAIPLNLSLGNPQWSEALAERAGWLAHQRIHTADMQLDPPELGPLQIKISVHQDQAVVSFVSANPQVRDLLDQNLVRLRELLQEQGLQLMDAGVSDQHRESGKNSGALAGEKLNGSAEDGTATTSDTSETHTRVDMAWGVDDFV
jgi:hypothetical protein